MTLNAITLLQRLDDLEAKLQEHYERDLFLEGLMDAHRREIERLNEVLARLLPALEVEVVRNLKAEVSILKLATQVDNLNALVSSCRVDIEALKSRLDEVNPA